MFAHLFSAAFFSMLLFPWYSMITGFIRTRPVRFVMVFGIALCCAFPLILHGQNDIVKHWVQFTDKNETPFSLLKPGEFVSPAAIERRWKTGSPFSTTDLPVDPAYLEQIKQLGATVLYTSRWFNSAVIMADQSIIKLVSELPFVADTEGVSFDKQPRIRFRQRTRQPDFSKNFVLTPGYHGYGYNQLAMHNGHIMHQWGFKGRGVRIGVFDGGFTNVDISPFFSHLRDSGRLIAGRDFVDLDDYPYLKSDHGSKVMSTMAAYVPYFMVGVAPMSTFFPFRTEDVDSETRIEEDNWVAALEMADSMGLDIVNSSLGYNTFDIRSQNYTYDDMNGMVSRSSIAAGMAAGRGFIVTVSAGNAGDGRWKYITAPADGFDILSVAAVDSDSSRARFSSLGPSADGRTKPNVAARGFMTTVAGIYGYNLEAAFGTSFAAPIVSGLAALLVEAFPDKSPLEIMDALKRSSHFNSTPDDELGYGIPNLLYAFKVLSNVSHFPADDTFAAARHHAHATVSWYWKTGGAAGEIRWYGKHGQMLYNYSYPSHDSTWLSLSTEAVPMDASMVTITDHHGESRNYYIRYHY